LTGTLTQDQNILAKVWSTTDAKKLLKEAYIDIAKQNSLVGVEVVSDTEVEILGAVSIDGPRQKKAKIGLLGRIKEIQEAESRQRVSTAPNELDLYFEIPRSATDTNPLDFWKENVEKFPILSQLARIYLAVPASSGSIERTFSVAGAIARARRAKMALNTLECILFYRDMVLASLE
jgi:hypothetical protein